MKYDEIIELNRKDEEDSSNTQSLLQVESPNAQNDSMSGLVASSKSAH